jgi:hypothetical protein
MWLIWLTLAAALPAGAAPQDGPEEARRIAIETLATQQGIERDLIEVKGTERLQRGADAPACTNDASSTAPQVVGYRVLLRGAGKLYVVQVTRGTAVICGRGLALASVSPAGPTVPQVSRPEPSDPASRALVAQARADLARHLAVAESTVVFVSFSAVTWPNGALGCPRPGMAYTEVPRDGVLIRFEAAGRRFDYHGGAGRNPFLCAAEGVGP